MNSIFDAARGPGDYHGTMRKDELEQDAGGKIFTSDNEETRHQVENTRYHDQTTSTRVASGATETRLTDADRYRDGNSAGAGTGNDRLSGGSGYHSSYDYEKSISSGISSSSQGQSGSVSGSSRGAIAQSEWKLLDNGTYIKVYHTKSTAGGAGRGSDSVGDTGNNYESGNSDSGWIVQPDGSRRRQQSSWSSSSSSTHGGGSTYHGGRGGIDSTSIGSSGISGNFNSGSTLRGTNEVSPSATETRLSSSSSSNRNEHTNTIFNAATGPGNYHGTMNKDELERDSGGRIFGSTNTETRNQVENTRYQGRGQSNNNVHHGSGNGAIYKEGSYYDQENRGKYNSGGRSRTGQTSLSSNRGGASDGGQTLFGSGYTSSSSSSSSSSGGSNRSSPPKGQWVWDQTADGGKGKWEWSTTTAIEENTSSVTKASGSQGGGYSSSDGKYTASSSTGNINDNDRGYIIQPNGTITDAYSSWDPSTSTHGTGRQRQNGRRTQSSRSSFREESSYGGVRLNSEDADEISKHFAHGEVLDHNRVGANGHETGDIGKDSTGKYYI